MPCTDGGVPYEDFNQQERLDIATRLACAYCRELEIDELTIPSYATKWWKEHKKKDANKKAELKREFLRIKKELEDME